MAMSQPGSLAEAVVLDARFVVAICSKEVGSEQIALTELALHANRGAEFFAPGVLISEALYVCCRKLSDTTLSPVDHAQAVVDLEAFVAGILPPPNGEASLVRRAEAIRSGYTCRRSADAIYIALAEQLALSRPTVLLTFDKDLPKQAARNAQGVSIKVL
jgi:predicted nucleic acid-binding protein